MLPLKGLISVCFSPSLLCPLHKIRRISKYWSSTVTLQIIEILKVAFLSEVWKGNCISRIADTPQPPPIHHAIAMQECQLCSSGVFLITVPFFVCVTVGEMEIRSPVLLLLVRYINYQHLVFRNLLKQLLQNKR